MSSEFKSGEMREEDAETTDMNRNAPAKKCSVRYQDSRSRLEEKDQHLKPGRPAKQSDPGQHVDVARKFDTGRQQKPWPSRKATGSEEVVKNMASVPSYLQCLEKGDSVQEKALNFGVLEWGSLEKWTHLQKQMANRRGGNSPSGSNASSSPFSTVGSSSWSTRSNDSPLAQRKQSPTLEVGRTYPDEARRTKLTKEQTFGQLLWLPDAGMRDHRRLSCDFAVASKGRSAEVNRSSFSASFRIDGCSHVSRPRPTPSTTRSGDDEPVVDGSPVSGNEKSAPNTKGKHGKSDILTDMPSAVDTADRSGQNEVKVPASFRREVSPRRLLRAGINRMRSSILREGSSGHQMKQARPSVHEDEQAANTRGRRSPLRRMLDPLLLKTNNRGQFSGPVASSPCRRAQETSSSSSASPVRDEKRARSARQALLKLAWKNGLPLFMFSSNDDDDIFAATVGRRSVSETNTSECIYTLFRAEEIKKKQGGLVYNVVGQMKVSPSKSCYREFVLLGAQLVPTGEPVNSPFSSELAAILVEVPSRSSESSKLDALLLLQRSNKCCNSSKTNSSLSSIVAILPRAVHGSSAVGEPSPLTERWKSGGSCDCGGWDEGCTLTVLADRATESISGCASDGTHHRIELFNQGDVRAKEHGFTMVAFKEGVHTVEFGPSIAVLQAFAICIATLHCRTPNAEWRT